MEVQQMKAQAKEEKARKMVRGGRKHEKGRWGTVKEYLSKFKHFQLLSSCLPFSFPSPRRSGIALSVRSRQGRRLSSASLSWKHA